MPTYEYACAKCGEHIEVYQPITDAPLTKHEGCGGALSKVFGSVGISFKGSGFYRTDNPGKRSAKPSSTKSDSGTTSSSSDTSGGSTSAS